MRTLIVSLGLLLAASGCTQRAIPVEMESHHKTLLLTPEVRVLDVTIPVGDTTVDHSHQYDIATVYIGPAVSRLRSPGEDWSAPRPREIGTATITEYVGKPGVHAVRNIGTTLYHIVAIESRHTTFDSTAQSLDNPAQTTLVQESRAFRAYDVKLAAGDGPLSHKHTLPTLVVVVEGEAMINAESSEGTQGKAKPGEWQLVPAGESHQFSAPNGQPVRLVEFEVR